MFQCTNLDYVQWRQSFWRQMVSKYRRMNIEERIMEVLTQGLEAGFQLETMDPTKYDLDLHFLIESQNEIGWLNLFKGIWSKQWIIMQNKWYTQNKMSESEIWPIGITSLCWSMWIQLWELRNGHHHGIEMEDRIRRNREN